MPNGPANFRTTTIKLYETNDTNDNEQEEPI